MSCYHPMIGIPQPSGSYKIVSSKDSEFFKWVRKQNPGSILVPCGRCIGCRLEYSRSWADRMMLELETAGKAVFITLTYNNEHVPIAMLGEDDVPVSFTLWKKDFQDFMKRLRRHFDPVKLRFYASGEYGENTFRPHYHAIIFGIGLDDFNDLIPKGKNELGQIYYISKTLEDIWSNGFGMICDVSWNTCAYVSRYVTKKVYGFDGKAFEFLNVVPEFSLMSRKPGIGRQYLTEHPDCLDFESINISTDENGLKIPIPKYYLKQLRLTDQERYDKLMKKRCEYADDRMLLKLQKTGLSFLDYLEVEEQNKLRSVNSLRRDKVT